MAVGIGIKCSEMNKEREKLVNTSRSRRTEPARLEQIGKVHTRRYSLRLAFASYQSTILVAAVSFSNYRLLASFSRPPRLRPVERT
jgi:hypothetical protein